MIAQNFPECNREFSAPEGLEESQVQTIGAYVGQIVGGSCDGIMQTVVAYRPTPEELAELNNGGLLYISWFGNSLVPHYPSVTFWHATHPA